jgi:hypothetical protein
VSDVHFCANGGYVVDVNTPLPSEPFDYQWLRMGPLVGCNQLRCTQCGQALIVRTPSRRAYAELVQLTEDERPARLSNLGNAAPGPQTVRVYGCACRVQSVEGGHQASQSTLDEDEQVPWQCAGHPVLPLPTRLDGVELDVDCNWTALARARLLESPPRDVPPALQDVAGAWVGRLYALLDARVRPRLAAAVASLLEDPAPQVRMGALRFFRDHFDAPEAASVGRAVLGHVELFPVAPVYERQQGLRSMAVEALSWIVPSDDTSLEALRLLATTVPGIGMFLGTLERHDAEWCAANRARIVRT